MATPIEILTSAAGPLPGLEASLLGLLDPGLLCHFVQQAEQLGRPIDSLRVTESVALRDPRTREQRQHDVFAGLLKAGVRNVGSVPGEMRSTADVTAVILLADVKGRSGAGWLEGVDGPVSASTVEQLSCDAHYRRVVLGADGEVLQLGRARYPSTVAQRRALATRDGGCVWPRCSAPPGWCDAHHVREFNSRPSS